MYALEDVSLPGESQVFVPFSSVISIGFFTFRSLHWDGDDGEGVRGGAHKGRGENKIRSNRCRLID